MYYVALSLVSAAIGYAYGQSTGWREGYEQGTQQYHRMRRKQ